MRTCEEIYQFYHLLNYLRLVMMTTKVNKSHLFLNLKICLVLVIKWKELLERYSSRTINLTDYYCILTYEINYLNKLVNLKLISLVITPCLWRFHRAFGTANSCCVHHIYPWLSLISLTDSTNQYTQPNDCCCPQRNKSYFQFWQRYSLTIFSHWVL